MFSITDYNYDLPNELIAQKPIEKREHSKLIFLHRKTGGLSHHKFYEICEFFLPSDILIVNNTEVVPGRLIGKKDTGGKAEILILDYAKGVNKRKDDNTFIYECLIKSSKRTRQGSTIFFDQGLKAEVINSRNEIYSVKFTCKSDFEELLYRIGKIPLPPYIRRDQDDITCDDKQSYQTVYASQKGAIAAPTAGFHFTEKLIEKIESKGVKIVEITLHVGYGTFLPVRVLDIRDHAIHAEWCTIPEKSAEIINNAKANGSRIIAVGTTCVRSLEYLSDTNGNIVNKSGNCDLFIYPGYKFKVIDAMITNFHLPKSTLLMLVSAFAGRKNILDAYKVAIKKRYRFYSYGDAMFIG
ncbi:MAG: tRNA preQ1(34) S-adenosylmethionine ribosyltransferase-isomerase QueA [Deltaproteobacteria bacterium]|nr:tRNA preQ1(34) S-adenosylmethionine ribosyltransferase-isomerase QueA [Deltaproteobacteria bacterium]